MRAMSVALIDAALPKLRLGLSLEIIVGWPFLEKAVLKEERSNEQNVQAVLRVRLKTKSSTQLIRKHFGIQNCQQKQITCMN